MNRRESKKGIAANATSLAPQFVSANISTHLPFHFIGLGGAGCNGLEAIYAKKEEGFFTCITDIARPHLPDPIQFITFPSPLVERIPAVEYLLNDTFALQPTAEMQALLSHPHHYVLLAGLGGYTGTRLLQTFAQQLSAQQQPFTIIASLPFSWETSRQKAVEQLLPSFQAFPQFHTFDLNELAAERENKNLKLNLFFQLANEKFYTIYQQLHTA